MRILFLLLLASITMGAGAQQVSGTARDAEGNAVNGATISLMKDTGTTVLKLAVTKEDGLYSFKEITPGSYRVAISHVAYQPMQSLPFTVTDADVTVPEIKLNKASGDMKNVVVTARKPMVEVKADKMIVNVEGTINAVGNDALELLRKSPG
jgi:ABC-type molybdate transport system ATPase subunit